MLAVYRGLPQEVAGLSASQVVPEEISTTPVAEFPLFRQRAISDGLTAQSLDDARRIIADLQNQLRESQVPAQGLGEPRIEPSPAASPGP
jgi:hypothetical protein